MVIKSLLYIKSLKSSLIQCPKTNKNFKTSKSVFEMEEENKVSSLVYMNGRLIMHQVKPGIVY